MRPILVALVLVGFVGLSGLTAAEVIESIEAKVNGEFIFASELNAAMTMKWSRPIETMTEEEYNRLRFEVFRDRAKAILLSQECRSILEKRGYDKRLTERRINRMADEFIGRYRARFDSAEAMRATMEKIGMTEESLRAQSLQVARHQYWDGVAYQLVRDRVLPVTEAEIKEFKAANPDAWKNYEYVRLSHILLRVPEGTPTDQEEKIKEKAENIALRAQAKEDFAALAQEFSEHEGTREKGGDFGVLRRGEALPEFDRFFDLPVGKPSDPIRTKLGYHIVLIQERNTLEDYLYSLKTRQEVENWIKEIISRPETVIVCKGGLSQDWFSGSGGDVEQPSTKQPSREN